MKTIGRSEARATYGMQRVGAMEQAHKLITCGGFSIFRHKRYDEELLLQALSRFGWECVSSIAFGPDTTTVALLLVKRDPLSRH